MVSQMNTLKSAGTYRRLVVALRLSGKGRPLFQYCQGLEMLKLNKDLEITKGKVLDLSLHSLAFLLISKMPPGAFL